MVQLLLPEHPAFKVSRRYRNHLAFTRNEVRVPFAFMVAFDDILAAPDRLVKLGAPDAALAFVTEAQAHARTLLIELARLAALDDDPLWVATTRPYQDLATLASQVTVLGHLARDRRALPDHDHTLGLPVSATADEVGAYMAAENAAIEHALNGSPAASSTSGDGSTDQ